VLSSSIAKLVVTNELATRLSSLHLDWQNLEGGLVTLWWLDGRWATFNETRIKVYVDEEADPGIDVQLYAAVGMGFDDESRVPVISSRSSP
jgi:hypothetical protein